VEDEILARSQTQLNPRGVLWVNLHIVPVLFYFPIVHLVSPLVV
jgi:hypothetical protein